MFKENAIFRALVALLFAFTLGYFGIIIIHSVFSNILNNLDNSVKNEYSRYKIGEFILKEISLIEADFYKMGIITKLRALEPIQTEIQSEIQNILDAIEILEKGGVLKSYIKLNLIETSSSVDEIYFKVDDKKYVFEAIDLIPKLDELKQKVLDMEEIMKIKISIKESTDEEYIKNNAFKVELFFKQIPTLFIRMKENSNRLLYDSKKNITILEKSIQKEKDYYKNLENIFTYIVMITMILLGAFVIRQIVRKNDELEEITKKAKKSEEEALNANETKSKFLANMSHEIRTPLNAIIGFSDILSNANMDDNDKEKAEIISKSAKALLNIINDILDISKIESGKYEVSKSNFDLKELLEQIVQLYAVNTKQKNIRFLYTLDESIPNFVFSDETKIKQVLSNILSNAIKFTPENKKVTFNVKLLKLENNIASVRFSVKDEGIGISLENQRSIFEPFSQADGTISRKYGGTGLGLAISLNIVKMLGSEIKLISRENEGSLFYFDLDLVIQDIINLDSSKLKYDFAICNIVEDTENIKNHLANVVKYFGRIHQGDEDIESCEKIDLIFCFGDPQFYDKLLRRKERFNCPVVYVGNVEKINNNNIMKPLMDYFLDVPIYGSKIFNIIAESKLTVKHIEKVENKIEHKENFSGKVLVAEDNPNNQLLIKIILQKLGLDVTIVENGQLAVEKYESENFDLIFLDINMPVMDGLAALKIIRAHEEKMQKRTPIIALTANTINGDRERYIDEGMDNYLSKPFERNQLISILELYLN
jgi:signal transduction histidine kinase/ActR/RegA family two-component response regulator